MVHLKKIVPQLKCSAFMIDSHISLLFRELNEIVKIIASRDFKDTNGYEIDLINNLKLLKNKMQKETWMDFDDLMIDEKSMKDELMLDTYELLIEMVENNDCYVATKVSRTLLRYDGKIFQGTAKMMTA